MVEAVSSVLVYVLAIVERHIQIRPHLVPKIIKDACTCVSITDAYILRTSWGRMKHGSRIR